MAEARNFDRRAYPAVMRSSILFATSSPAKKRSFSIPRFARSHQGRHLRRTGEDLGELAVGCGLSHARDVKAFVSKVMVFDKPAVA
jgi:hypothetical protein